MKPNVTEVYPLLVAILLITIGFLEPFSAQAQTNTNRTAAMRAVAMHLRAQPMVTKTVTNAGKSQASVALKLPQDMSRYHTLEQHALVTRPATNLTISSPHDVTATLSPGSTLLFMEKEAVKPAKATTGPTPLFSTLLVKASTPTRPGERQRASSGTLTILTDIPTPWNDASNAYVARLSVMFLTEEADNLLLPMAVGLSGANVKNIEPRKIELLKPGVDGSQDVIVTCDRYQPDVRITATYSMTNTTRELPLQRLTAWNMTQMIISKPMLFAALTGALGGGLLRLLKKSKWELRRTLHYLAEALAVGVVTVTLLLSGLLHNQIAGLSSHPQLVMAFALAAVAGSVGAHFLDKSIKQLRGG
jgi:hypothetical protein